MSCNDLQSEASFLGWTGIHVHNNSTFELYYIDVTHQHQEGIFSKAKKTLYNMVTKLCCISSSRDISHIRFLVVKLV